MLRRTIMIFPRFDNIEVIDQIRKQYDPLTGLVKPHITVVFPFSLEWDRSSIERKMKEALNHFKPFSLLMTGISKEISNRGCYLFLNISQGKEKIQQISRLLYENLFGQGQAILVEPHMTIGKFGNPDELALVYDHVISMTDVFSTIVDCISVEIIGENDESIIEIEYHLDHEEQ
jgi:2'-5' RNA ligase